MQTLLSMVYSPVRPRKIECIAKAIKAAISLNERKFARTKAEQIPNIAHRKRTEGESQEKNYGCNSLKINQYSVFVRVVRVVRPLFCGFETCVIANDN